MPCVMFPVFALFNLVEPCYFVLLHIITYVRISDLFAFILNKIGISCLTSAITGVSVKLMQGLITVTCVILYVFSRHGMN